MILCGKMAGIDFNNLNNHTIRLTPNFKIYNNNKNVFFGNIKQDTFETTTYNHLFNESEIKKMIASSPELKKILNTHKIPIHLNMKELHELRDGHASETQKIAIAIANNLPAALKQQVNIKNLKDGALLHDFGKVLIPPNILNKEGRLTDEEHKIMDLHSELGYLLLKNSGVDEKVLSLVQNHHLNFTNYKTRNFVPDINLQILNIADKYSALTEKRVYKDAYTKPMALTILSKEVQEGKIHPFLFNALVKATSNNLSQEFVK